jgi:hypothetical protein
MKKLNVTPSETIESKRLIKRIDRKVQEWVNTGLVSREDVERAEFIAAERQRQRSQQSAESPDPHNVLFNFDCKS